MHTMYKRSSDDGVDYYRWAASASWRAVDVEVPGLSSRCRAFCLLNKLQVALFAYFLSCHFPDVTKSLQKKKD